LEELKGKVALVTGGGGAGCGGAIARRLAREGAAIVVLDIHGGRANAVAEDIRGTFGVPAIACVCDVADREALDEGLARSIEALGPIDIVVNNAAENVQKPIFDFDPADFDRVIAVDLTACWYVIRKTIGSMRDRGGGVIVNISSIAAYMGGGGLESPYGAAKAGLNDLTRGIAIEGGPYSIRCNGVAIGLVRSKFVEKHWAMIEPHIQLTPLRRLAEPHELAELVCFLASNRSSFITGEIINFSGGYFPGQ
jgi:NAD(P)-dependent dehydrogenase (short-subunit alcohol dehydrogenase family)